MPLALSTDETFDVWLETDAHLPVESRPTFVFRYLTSREWRKVAKFGDDREAMEALTGVDINIQLFDLLRVNLVDWRNMAGIAFDPDKLEDILTFTEAWELYYSARRQSRLDIEAKKESASPSAISTAASATAAPATTAANAETSQASSSL